MSEFYMITKAGNRENNEDAYYGCNRDDVAYFIVADGLGGHGQGEVASAFVVERIKDFFDRNCTMSPDEIINASIDQAQEDLLQLQIQMHAKNDLKTTIVALYIKNNQLCWAHVGDSRLYAFSKNKVKYQTKDHSIPQMLVLSGDISEKKIRNHPQRNMLLRVMGIEWETAKQEISPVYQLTDFQAFLLCSDGFWELITEKEMCRLLKRSKSAKEWLNSMTILVEKNGANKEMDNYTAIAVVL